MKDKYISLIITSILAVIWFCIGFRNGFVKGQSYERKAMMERLNFIDSLHKKDKSQINNERKKQQDK